MSTNRRSEFAKRSEELWSFRPIKIALVKAVASFQRLIKEVTACGADSSGGRVWRANCLKAHQLCLCSVLGFAGWIVVLGTRLPS
ncbi:MAG: hypothetical protein NVV74_03645 [Magnetospirillum sp.]|nr:hypothetical protein [Magnetospirillum sp.]